MRRSLAISSFGCSISLSRERSCSCVAISSSCCATISAFNASGHAPDSDPDASRPTCVEYRMNLGATVSSAQDKLCKSVSRVTRIVAGPRCVPYAASQLAPAEHLVGVDLVRPRYSRQQRSFHQRLVDKPPLVLPRPAPPPSDDICDLRGTVHLRSKWTRSMVSTSRR